MRIIQKLIILSFAILLIMPTAGKEKLKTTRLVELAKLDPTLKLDIKYATKNNFLGRPFYKEAKAYLQKHVAEDLVKVSKKLNKKGYGLIIFDGYRPWSVTKIFWDETPPEKRKFVADPKIGSNHNRGCAVDLSLYNLKTQKELKMPCAFDTFSEVAFPTYKGSTNEERANRDLLRKAMESENFTVHPNEYWHFDYKDCDKYEILDITFEKLLSEGLLEDERLYS